MDFLPKKKKNIPGSKLSSSIQSIMSYKEPNNPSRSTANIKIKSNSKSIRTPLDTNASNAAYGLADRDQPERMDHGAGALISQSYSNAGGGGVFVREQAVD